MRYLTYGFLRILQRPGLTFLLYAANVLLGFIVALNIRVFANVVNTTGFSQELATRFDIVLWADILEKASTSLGSAFLQTFWLIPLYLLWKVVSSAGLIYAFRHGEIASFWRGVATYTGRALLLSIGYLIPLGILLVLEFLLALGLNALWPGEVGTFRIYVFVLPTLVVLTIWGIQVLHDFGRVALISGEQRVWDAWKTGLTWPFRHWGAFSIVFFWSVLAAVLVALPLVFDPTGIHRTLALWGLFLLYQVFFLLRAATTVGWTASEVFYFEDRERALTLTPSTPALPESPPTHAPDSDQSASVPDRSGG